MDMDQELWQAISGRERSALVVWDVQNALVEGIFNTAAFLSGTNELIAAARQRNVPVFFSKITRLPERFESAPRKYLWRNRKLGASANDWEMAIAPSPDDIVISKNTASIFIGTNFELMVRSAGITTLIFAGIATEMGIESSGRNALNRGFFAVIARDAVSSFDREAHARSLANMERMLIVMNNAEILQLWNV
jgi:nicotinamidase-related amidase